MSDPELDGATSEEEEETECSSVMTDDPEDGEMDDPCEDEGHGPDEEWTEEFTRDVIGMILQFLEASGLEESYKALWTEYSPLLELEKETRSYRFSPHDVHLLYKYFDSEQSAEMLEQWTKLLNTVDSNGQENFRKITFFLRIFAAAIPFRKNESCELKAQSLTQLRNFFQEKTEEFATDEKMLSLFALPFVQDPAVHPVFKEIFQDSWKSKLRAQIRLSVKKFCEIENVPQIENSDLAALYLHQRQAQPQSENSNHDNMERSSEAGTRTRTASVSGSQEKYRCTSRLELSASVSALNSTRSLPPPLDSTNEDEPNNAEAEDPGESGEREGNSNSKEQQRMDLLQASETIEALHENLRSAESTLLDVELRYHKLLKVTAEMVAALEAAVQGRDQDMATLQAKVTSVFPELFTAFHNLASARQNKTNGHFRSGHCSRDNASQGDTEQTEEGIVLERAPEELQENDKNAVENESDLEEYFHQNGNEEHDNSCGSETDDRNKDSTSQHHPNSNQRPRHHPTVSRPGSEEAITDIDLDLEAFGVNDPEDPDFDNEELFEMDATEMGGGDGDHNDNDATKSPSSNCGTPQKHNQTNINKSRHKNKGKIKSSEPAIVTIRGKSPPRSHNTSLKFCNNGQGSVNELDSGSGPKEMNLNFNTVLSSHPSTCQMPPVPPFNVAKKNQSRSHGEGGVTSQRNEVNALSKRRNYVKSMEGSLAKLTFSSVAPTPRSQSNNNKGKLRPSASASPSGRSCQGQGQGQEQQQGISFDGQFQGQSQRRHWVVPSTSSGDHKIGPDQLLSRSPPDGNPSTHRTMAPISKKSNSICTTSVTTSRSSSGRQQ